MTKKKGRKAVKRVVKAKPENKLFPGLPRYTGPNEGLFAFVHHAVMYEWSHDIKRRVHHVRTMKPEDERAIRLRHIMYLGPKFGALSRKCKLLNSDVLTRARRQIKNLKWNGRSLTKDNGSDMTG